MTIRERNQRLRARASTSTRTGSPRELEVSSSGIERCPAASQSRPIKLTRRPLRLHAEELEVNREQRDGADRQIHVEAGAPTSCRSRRASRPGLDKLDVHPTVPRTTLVEPAAIRVRPSLMSRQS